MSITEFYIQFIGALGYFLLANSYFSKEKKKLLIIQIASNIFLAIHFYFLSGIAGAICDIVSVISDTIIYVCDKKKVKNKVLLTIILIAFLFLSCFGTLYLVHSPFTYKEVFPIFATCMILVSLISNSKSFIRIVGLIAAICWLVYGIICGSVAGIFFEIVIIISTIASYIKGKLTEND